jgi:hypothetical protein
MSANRDSRRQRRAEPVPVSTERRQSQLILVWNPHCLLQLDGLGVLLDEPTNDLSL